MDKKFYTDLKFFSKKWDNARIFDEHIEHFATKLECNA